MSALAVVVDVALLALVLVRQLRVRPVPRRLRLQLPAVLGLVGLWQLLDYTDHRHLSGPVVLVLLASLVVGAGALGALRALSVRLWAQGPFVLRQGTWGTMTLWAVSLGLHFLAGWGVHVLGGPSDLAGASLLLYLAVTYGVQRAVVHGRARPLLAAAPAGPVAGSFGGPGLRAVWFGAAGPGGRPGPGASPPAGPPIIDAESEPLPPGTERSLPPD